jgi:hypothetical protein
MPFTGTIADESALGINEVTVLSRRLLINGNMVLGGIGVTKLNATSESGNTWLNGVATGVWNGLLISGKDFSNISTQSAAAQPKYVLYFDPPINKGENDKITFNIAISQKNS